MTVGKYTFEGQFDRKSSCFHNRSTNSPLKTSSGAPSLVNAKDDSYTDITDCKRLHTGVSSNGNPIVALMVTFSG